MYGNIGRYAPSTESDMRVIALFLLAFMPFLANADHERYWDDIYQAADLGSSRVEVLPIPVYGFALSELDQNFGDPRGDGTRMHEGLDMVAPRGTPVASPTEAVVMRTGDGSDSGIYIRTANPGGEQFVFMHLDAIAPGITPGTRVARGEIIGFVGNTGNASGGGAHLHFEIRKNGATDPYPRLGAVFTDAEWETAFSNARAKGVTIAVSGGALRASPPTPASVSTTPIGTRASLVYGQTNNDVVALQQFLIANSKGSAGERLARTGATGYFGPLTRETLIEYQRFAGLSASGVVDDATYALVSSASPTASAEVQLVTASPSPTSSFLFARDLELGMENIDVRELQKFLNANGFAVATSGAGSPGSETTYFGSLTQTALARYQAAQGINPPAGYFGPITRSHIAATAF